MIKINNPDIQNISDSYFKKIKDECLQRVDFYLQVMDVLFHGTNFNVLETHKLNGNTKKSLVNLVLQPVNKLNDQLNYHTVIVANCKPWVTANEIILNRVLTYLSVQNNLEQIILCKPQDCYKLDNTLKNSLGLTTAHPLVKEVVIKILDYDLFDKYAYWLGKSIGINTCPYCNRVWIHTVFDINKNEVIRPQFDHFYPQSKHPFLGLSFFNLIPSCYYCNSSLKKAGDIFPNTHLHPYIEGYDDDYFFHVKIDYVKSQKSDPENYKISLKPSAKITAAKLRQIVGNTNTEGNLKLFKLEDIYPSHLDIVGEIVVKCNKYSSWYSGPFLKLFGSLLSTNKSEFYQFYFGNYLNELDFHQRPLSKMTKDVVKQVLPNFLK